MVGLWLGFSILILYYKPERILTFEGLGFQGLGCYKAFWGLGGLGFQGEGF